MDYVIKNHKNVFIKLGENGRPVTCVESEKELFNYSKAKNILDNLPKTLKRLKFTVAAHHVLDSDPPKIIQNNNYSPSENITQWIEKFGVCADTFNEAKKRKEYLLVELEKMDKELLDILHIVEMENSKDLYGGWKEYKRIQENRERRRTIKDELLIIGNVLERIDPSCLERKRIQKAIDGLFGRKYSFRIVDE